MIFPQSEWTRRLEAGGVRLALIGMSNIGKSHWTQLLAEAKGFAKISVDAEIARQLGLPDVDQVAAWMGQPYEERYREAEKKYLALEDAITGGISLPDQKNLVVDTTGSVVYLRKKTHQFLKKNFLILHLEVTPNLLTEMIERYFSQPKPVIWGAHYRPAAKESPEETLKRCYPLCLTYRLERYRELADVTISGEISLDPKLTVDQFLEAIRGKLP